jgi:hypothetical protein
MMKVKTELMEQEVFVEGFGGSSSLVLLFHQNLAKEFQNYLETILLLAELEDFTGKAKYSCRRIYC